MTLHSEITVDRGRFTLEMEFSAEPGETVGLLGPNGSGKSTALRVLAGLLPLSAGRVELEGDVLDDAAEGTFVPPENRAVGVVFQNRLLFPHMSALENVAFGLRARGVDRSVARARAGSGCGGSTSPIMSPSGLAHCREGRRNASRWPGHWSPIPGCCCSTSRFAALDVNTRVQVRAQLRHHLVDYPGTTVMVTHDLMDAMAVADRLVVIEAGRVAQVGTPSEIAMHPRSDYVARLVGLNLYSGAARGTTVDLPTVGHSPPPRAPGTCSSPSPPARSACTELGRTETPATPRRCRFAISRNAAVVNRCSRWAYVIRSTLQR